MLYFAPSKGRKRRVATTRAVFLSIHLRECDMTSRLTKCFQTTDATWLGLLASPLLAFFPAYLGVFERIKLAILGVRRTGGGFEHK